MLLESCQLLCTAKKFITTEEIPGEYKSTHVNHPSSVWVRQSHKNFTWLIEHAFEISNQYTLTYGKIHKSKKLLQALHDWALTIEENRFPIVGLTVPPQCMPEKYKDLNYVTAYRNYYLGDKVRFAKWKNRSKPDWWK